MWQRALDSEILPRDSSADAQPASTTSTRASCSRCTCAPACKAPGLCRRTNGTITRLQCKGHKRGVHGNDVHDRHLGLHRNDFGDGGAELAERVGALKLRYDLRWARQLSISISESTSATPTSGTSAAYFARRVIRPARTLPTLTFGWSCGHTASSVSSVCR